VQGAGCAGKAYDATGKREEQDEGGGFHFSVALEQEMLESINCDKERRNDPRRDRKVQKCY
jgi:hypothetical protein